MNFGAHTPKMDSHIYLPAVNTVCCLFVSKRREMSPSRTQPGLATCWEVSQIYKRVQTSEESLFSTKNWGTKIVFCDAFQLKKLCQMKIGLEILPTFRKRSP